MNAKQMSLPVLRVVDHRMVFLLGLVVSSVVEKAYALLRTPLTYKQKLKKKTFCVDTIGFHAHRD